MTADLAAGDPPPAPLGALVYYACRICRGLSDFEDPRFSAVLDALPLTRQWDDVARAAGRIIVNAMEAAQKPLALVLFRKRFGVALGEGWKDLAKAREIAQLWTLVEALPARDISGIARIDLIAGAMSFYEPDSRRIVLANTVIAKPDTFAEKLRHEVGHFVRDGQQRIVDEWLQQLGWRTFGADELDDWVGLMGGWGPIDDATRTLVATFLRNALGNGGTLEKIVPPGADTIENNPAISQDLGPYAAYLGTTDNWFSTYEKWYAHGDWRFFINCYYCQFTAVKKTVLDIVYAMGTSYAAMSPREFFAEVYRVYRTPGMIQLLPETVRSWLDSALAQTGADVAPPEAGYLPQPSPADSAIASPR
jgi:hypothetical protein